MSEKNIDEYTYPKSWDDNPELLSTRIRLFTPNMFNTYLIPKQKLELENELTFFNENKKMIEEKYGRKTYVAIYNNQIIGFGNDQFKLYIELIKEYKKKPFLIQSIEQSETIFRIDTP